MSLKYTHIIIAWLALVLVAGCGGLQCGDWCVDDDGTDGGGGDSGGSTVLAPTLNLAVGSGIMELTWDSTGDSFEIMRDGSDLASSTSLAYDDSSVANGTRYCYIVRAFDATGASADSNERCGTPMDVPIGGGIPKSLSATLNWSDVGAASYDLYFDSSFVGPFPSLSASKDVSKAAIDPGDTLIASDVAATTYELTGLSNDCVNYPIKVVPKDSDGNLLGEALLIEVMPDTEGTLDATFGMGGLVEHSDDAAFTDAVVLADGTIVVLKNSNTPPLPLNEIIGYDENGALLWNLDVTSPMGIRLEVVQTMAVDSEGRLLVGGQWHDKPYMRLCRFIASASGAMLDDSFGFNGCIGEITYTAISIGIANDIAFDSQNRIVVGGTFTSALIDYISVWRFNEDGSLDTTFSPSPTDGPGVGEADQGQFVHDPGGIPGSYARASSVAVAMDGGFERIFVAGWGVDFVTRMTMVKVDDDGIQAGVYNEVASHGQAMGLEVLQNGEILVTGYTEDVPHAAITWNGPNYDTAMYYSNGDIVVTGGTALDCHDRAIVAGYASTATDQMSLTRTNEYYTGVDINFAAAGWFVTAEVEEHYANAVAVDALGRLIVVGYQDILGTFAPRMWRFQ